MRCVETWFDGRPRLRGAGTAGIAAARRVAVFSVCLLSACTSLVPHEKVAPDADVAPAREATSAEVAPVRAETSPDIAPSRAATSADAKVVSPGATTSPALPSGVVPAPNAAPVPPPVDPAVLAQFEAALSDLSSGKFDTAQAALEALAKAHPDMGGIHANLGIALRRQDKLAESAEHLQTAVTLDPLQPVFWNQLGMTDRMLGKFTDAKQAYEKSMALDPGYASPVLNLAILTDLYLWNGSAALPLYEKYQSMQSEADPKVAKWIADLRNRLKAEARGASAGAGVNNAGSAAVGTASGAEGPR